MAVVGPSGAGKTTLLNALTGFRPATSGTVLYSGWDLYDSYEALRHRIGFVPQDDVLHPQLTVRRALEYAAELRFPPDVSKAERKGEVARIMEQLGILARADLPIRQLSGGQRKRTSIALELLTRPSLLILDEPTSGLDPGIERAVMQLLRRLADDGRTVIVVTHSVQSLDLCDRVLYLAVGGKMAFFGAAQGGARLLRRTGLRGDLQQPRRARAAPTGSSASARTPAFAAMSSSRWRVTSCPRRRTVSRSPSSAAAAGCSSSAC